ncbi:Hypothetical predicted protein [Marmota monax]|uniref:Uncharacterized protein n=1 Tax=Marmota monax TaxID=9995 RepID=A0A5E4CST0_MARMO|nr:hypothetical protein GHT09_016976 [Marmota monax]VTJ84844.1 Hypothetical predicted protein [Marmota monax]
MGCQDTLGNVNVGTRALLALLVSKVFLVLQEKKVQRVIQDLRVSQGKMDQQDYVVSQVNEVFLELRVHLD